MSVSPPPDRAQRASAWPGRLAFAAAVLALPLVAFGGTVTTLHAGLAIDGWWILEPGRGDHFLWFYPVEKWFRDIGTFVEHTHRLIATGVGLLATATVIATFAADRRPSARVLALAGLLAVCGQGLIGGLRVLEKSEGLAFLHGALGQAVFAVLVAVAIGLSPRWQEQRQTPCKHARRLGRQSLLALGLGSLAIVAGAWLRHPMPGEPLSHVALGAHLIGALATVAAALALARTLLATAEAGAAGGEDRSILLTLRRRLLAVLLLQVLLGLGAFWIVVLAPPEGQPGLHGSFFPTAHVVMGALLLAQLTAAALWSRRTVRTAAPSGSVTTAGAEVTA